jgi:hypothetical protein
MIRNGVLILAAMAVTGCTDTTTLDFEGDDISDYFPFDGYRKWTYQSTDTTVPYYVVAETAEESELIEDSNTRIYTLNFTYQCFGIGAPCDVDDDEDGTADLTGTPAWSWRLSANTSTGTQIHQIGDVTFDPPVQVATRKMFRGDSVTSESGGTFYTSTYVGTDVCPAPYWRDSPPDECVYFQIDDGGAGSPAAGEIWSIYQFSIVGFSLGGDEHRWEMLRYEDQL